MVAIKLFGIIVAFQIFIVRDAFAQNFYPARYGKRNENGLRLEHLSEGKRLEPGDEENSLTDRKVRFFFSGGRYGKRRCFSEKSDKCFEGSKEFMTSGFVKSRNPSDRINLPIRKNQFMMGSRFGKRMEASIPKGVMLGRIKWAVRIKFSDPRPLENVWCVLAFNEDFYKCPFKATFKNDSPSLLLNYNLINETDE